MVRMINICLLVPNPESNLGTFPGWQSFLTPKRPFLPKHGHIDPKTTCLNRNGHSDPQNGHIGRFWICDFLPKMDKKIFRGPSTQKKTTWRSCSFGKYRYEYKYRIGKWKRKNSKNFKIGLFATTRNCQGRFSEIFIFFEIGFWLGLTTKPIGNT